MEGENTMTELDFIFNNPIKFDEPELKTNESSFICEEEVQQIEIEKSENKKQFPKRFFYNDDYEIYYSNRKNKIMIRNYKIGKYRYIKLSSFILRYHDNIKQHDTLEIRTCKMMIDYFELQLKNGNLSCNFFINEDDDRLWVVIKTDWTEYLYDITSHFLILCCDEENYWFSLLDCEYINYYIDYTVASNKAQYEIFISFLHGCLKHLYFTSRDTTN